MDTESLHYSCSKKMELKKNEFRWVNQELLSFADIDIPSDIPILNFRGNKITDFIGFGSFDSVKILILDDNPILSFRGIEQLPNLQEVSLQHTPISKLLNFRELAILAFGFQLQKLNGYPILPEEKSRALSYGDPLTTFSFISRGWLPRRPTAYIKPKALSTRKKSQDFSQIPLINSLLISQENDPISVRFVRLLNETGATRKEIRSCISNYFSTQVSTKKRQIKKKKSKYMKQIEKQDEIINLLALQIIQLRNENGLMRNYEKMLMTTGSSLIENQMILENRFIQQNKDETSNFEDENDESFEELRNVMVKCVQSDVLISNTDLIQLFHDTFEKTPKP